MNSCCYRHKSRSSSGCDLPQRTTRQSGPRGIGTIVDDSITDVRLGWEPLSGATKYEWQLNDDEDFTTEPVLLKGETKATSVRLPELELAITYYWRVRAIQPMLGPWSDKWSFTTSLVAGLVAPHLQSPEAGASDVEIKPVF